MLCCIVHTVYFLQSYKSFGISLRRSIEQVLICGQFVPLSLLEKFHIYPAHTFNYCGLFRPTVFVSASQPIFYVM